jgi:hypothetical protein
MKSIESFFINKKFLISKETNIEIIQLFEFQYSLLLYCFLLI